MGERLPGNEGAVDAPLRLLHLEDDPNDAELVRSSLDADGLACEVRLVSTRETFLEALQKERIDLILSDFALPTFDGLSALKIKQEKAPDLPFIIVSGTLGEEAAIDSLRCGATDYVLKHRLTRLGPAVRRALGESRERRERQQLEVQLRQAQKMEAVGRLAGGVAHDFNNLLNVIMGYGELLLERLAEDDPSRSKIVEIRSAAERAASLTRQLLAFSRNQVIQPRILDLNVLLAEMEKMLRRLIGEDVELSTRRPQGLDRVKADPGQIEQILMNLVVNARDAMPDGGKLAIEVANVDLDDAFVRSHPGSRPGRFVIIEVSDSGMGMDAEVQSHIFEPFFTTKEAGKGTGLGLATVYGIVKQNDGYIEVESAPGRGATFRVYLPRVEAPAEKARPEATGEPPRGTETILVVEDEPVVRGLIQEILTEYGYTVLVAGDVDEAEQACERHPGTIHLLMTDVVLPKANGREVAIRVARQRPEVKVLYTSGYTDSTVVRQGIMERGAAFLQKPFPLTTLARKVREVLDAPQAVLQ